MDATLLELRRKAAGGLFGEKDFQKNISRYAKWDKNRGCVYMKTRNTLKLTVNAGYFMKLGLETHATWLHALKSTSPVLDRLRL